MNFRDVVSFDDVLLTPRYSSLASRADADISTRLVGHDLTAPILSANMKTVTETSMACAMQWSGGLGVTHRMQSIEAQVEMLEDIRDVVGWSAPVAFSFGVKDWKDRVEASIRAVQENCVAVLDIAHADHESVERIVSQWFDTISGSVPLIIGNIATFAAAQNFIRAINHSDRYEKVAFKVGIGGGSLCTTRVNTGFGVPTLQSVIDVKGAIRNYGVPVGIIADGGIRSSGDIVKSLAAGADAVMIGSLLAGTKEAPGDVVIHGGEKYKVYRGSASYGDKVYRGESAEHVEGAETMIRYKGDVREVMDKLKAGIRSGFSYGGAKTLAELQDEPEFVRITSSGLQESLAHGVFV